MITIIIYADGGCFNSQNKDKRFAYGSYRLTYEEANVIVVDDIQECVFGQYTSNEAEYMTLLESLRYAHDLVDHRKAKTTVYMDSLLVVKHLQFLRGDEEGWQCSAQHLKSLLNEAEALLGEVGGEVVKVPRKEIVEILGH